MRSILEKALTFVLNEEREKADELFHQFMIGRSRQIHESLRLGEDPVIDDEIAENYFTEDDLEGVEDEDEFGDEEGMDGAADELDGEMGGDQMDGQGDQFGGDQMGDQMGGQDGQMGDQMGGDQMGDQMGDEGSLQDRIEDLEGELEQLTSQFQELMGTQGQEDGMDFDPQAGGQGDQFGGDQMGGDQMGADGEDMAAADDEEAMGDSDNMADAEEEMGDDEKFGEAEELDFDESFDDITESIVSELEKVSVTMSDGKTSDGKSFTQNTKSPMEPHGVNDRTKQAKPIEMGRGEKYSGYERETAPSTKMMKKRQNVKSSGEEGRTKVTKDGAKGALLNTLSSEDGNLVSPLSKVGNNRGFK